MKVIDLLNKIANGEEVPFLIKYEDIILKYDLEAQDYRIYQNGYFFTKLFERPDCKFLNDEVEIIEEHKEPKEHKIPEKLDEYADVSGDLAYGWSFAEKKLKDKINEILDYLEEIE